MATKPGKTVNRKGLAEIFGVSLPTVDHWVRRGCPTLEKKGQEWQFDTGAVLAWRTNVEVERALERQPEEEGQDDPVRRKLAAEASLAELKLAREAGQLVAIEDVESEWEPKVAGCRARLLAIPADLALLVHAAETVEEVQSIIETAIHEALHELANAGGGEEDDDASDSDDDAEDVDSESLEEV